MTSFAQPDRLPAGDQESQTDLGFLFAETPAVTSVEPRFAERPAAKLRRWALGTAYALRLGRLPIIPWMLFLSAEFLISPEAAASRLDERKYRGSQGLVGVSDDLSPEALLAAYRQGLFPLSHLGPTKWWSPPERAVLPPGETRIEKSFRRALRKAQYRVTFDTDFAAVIRGCAEPRPGKTPLTWITPRTMRAFWALHKAGHAHSVEVWDAQGKLVGGLYGVASGDVFFGESQFSRVPNASKIAGVTLNRHLAHWGFVLRDAKFLTGHLAALGFRNIERDAFEAIVREHASKPGRVGRWTVDETLDVATWQTKS